MPSSSTPRFQMFYWNSAFRRCFISYLFAYQELILQEDLKIQASIREMQANAE